MSQRMKFYDISFVFILVVSFLTRIPYIILEKLGSDESLYAWYAKKIFLDPSFIFSREIIEYHPPLFPMIISMGNFFLPPGLIAYRAIVLIINLTGIIFIYLLGIRLSSKFLGLFCAMTLAFNYIFFFNGTLIMIDCPLTVLFIILFWFMTQIENESHYGTHIFAGILSSLIILLKWSGIVVIPFLMTYYLFLPKESLCKKIKTLLIPLSVIGFEITVLVIMNLTRLGSVWPNVSALTTKSSGLSSVGYYVLNFHNILMVPSFLPLFVYGGYFILRTRYKYKILCVAYFSTIFTAISLTPGKDLRYGLLMLPVMIPVTGIGLEQLLENIFRKSKKTEIARILATVICFLLLWIHYPRITMLMNRNNTRLTGYSDASKWIKQNVTSDSIIISESPRIIRYFSDINLEKYGGRLVSLPDDKKAFEAFITTVEKHIILQLDIWSEYKKTDFPPVYHRGQEEEYFKELGFQLKKEICRELFFSEEKKRVIPVIRIYERKPLDKKGRDFNSPGRG